MKNLMAEREAHDVHDHAVSDVAPRQVRFIPSARFYVESLQVPAGLNGRDLSGFVESNIEELSVFPLESTSWGFVASGSKQELNSVLAYAAYRDQIIDRSEPSHDDAYALLPGVICLVGLSMKQTTWIVLVESCCVTLARIPTKEHVPDYVRSVFSCDLESDPSLAWNIREELLNAINEGEGEHFEEGLLRCTSSTIGHNGGVQFTLDKQASSDSDWKRFGSGKLTSVDTILTADVRDKSFLVEERAQRASVRRLRGFVRLFSAFFIVLCFFQARYIVRKHQFADISRQVVVQRPAVQALKEQEELVKSAATLSQAPLEIFTWLDSVNALRPETIAFHTVYAYRDGILGFNGEAPSVLAVNQYRDALEKSGLFSAVEVKELNSVKRGVTFTLEVTFAHNTSQVRQS